MLRGVSVLVALWAGAGVAGRPEDPQSAARANGPAVPFAVGETLRYDVTWSGMVTAGTATISVKGVRELGGGARAYQIVAEGQPSALLNALHPLYYAVESLLNTRSLVPTQCSVFSRERGQVRTEVTGFGADGSMTFRVSHPGDPEPPAADVRRVPSETRDPLSAVFYLRARSLRRGESWTLPIATEGKLYRTRVTVSGPETISTALGRQSAWHLVPEVADEGTGLPAIGRLDLWLSDDTRRLPLRFEAELPVGTFVITLARATAGAGR